MPNDAYRDAPRLPENGAIDLRELMGAGTSPVELEIGPGRGWFLVERLRIFPDLFMVGLEIRRKWATIVDRRLSRLGLGERARVFAEDVRLVMPRLTDASLGAVYLHFPDPWWKRRHEKRRLLTPDLVGHVARTLAPGGELFLQTDVRERAALFADIVGRDGRLAPAEDSPWVSEHPYLARSPRERRVIDDGLPVYRLRYQRPFDAAPVNAP